MEVVGNYSGCVIEGERAVAFDVVIASVSERVVGADENLSFLFSISLSRSSNTSAD